MTLSIALMRRKTPAKSGTRLDPINIEHPPSQYSRPMSVSKTDSALADGLITMHSAVLPPPPTPPRTPPPPLLHHGVDSSGNINSSSIAAVAPDHLSSTPADADAEKEGNNPKSPVVPQAPIVPPDPRDLHPPTFHPSLQVATAAIEDNAQSASGGKELRTQELLTLPDLHESLDEPASITTRVSGDKMLFGNNGTANAQAAQAAQRRRNYATTNSLTDYEADMTSKDRAKQKEAVKKYLSERIKQDWTWEWPRVDPESDTSSELMPNVARTFTGEERWKERDEWLSNASDDDEPTGMPRYASSHDTPSTKTSSNRHENAVDDSVKKPLCSRKQRRRKRLAEELSWNSGLQCFVSRRDAWTGARRLARPSPGSILSSTAKRCSGSSSSTAEEKDNNVDDDDDEWEDVEIPIAPPILPPDNQMRASILPTAYGTIYDKVVIQSLQPSCPMNLRDVTRSCVQGWKRDGEWPPKSAIPEPKKKGRKMSVASLFGLDKHEREDAPKDNEKDKEKDEKKSTGSGIRKSIQKILSLGHGTKEKDREAPHNLGVGKLSIAGEGPGV